MLHRLGTASLIAAFVASGTAFAAGYEKAIMFGGRSAGVAGIASPYIQGPQALYFNPAGLVSDKVGHGVDLNVTALQSQFKGPIDNSNTVAESKKKVLTPFGLMYGATLNEKFGFGIGGYISAGSQAKYEDITIATPPANTATGQGVETDLTVAEIAIGGAYKVMPNLRVGAAYRVSMVDGQFAFIQRGASGTVVNAKVEDLKGTNFMGYKIGAQYDVSENTKIGLNYRSQTDLQVKGKFGGTVDRPLALSTLNIDANNATAKTTLPQAVTLGVQHMFGPSWAFLAEYVWTQYSRVEHVTLDGAVTVNGGTALNPADPDAGDLEMQWKDQHQLKLAGEYLGMGMPLRFGYIWTSQVTHDDYARAAFTPPGAAHTVTLGTGYNFGESFKLDGGLDYTWVKGDGNGAAAGTTGAGTDIRAGKFETTAYALHLGLSYNF